MLSRPPRQQSHRHDHPRETPCGSDDELLTSWLERIWIFYGATYEMGVSALLSHANQSPLDQSVDIDSISDIRDHVCRWTGVSPDFVPKLLSGAPGLLLPVSARLAYCPACWDDDVAAGRSPYIRRQWTQWSAVHCRIHSRWLNARRPPHQREFYLMGWAPIWRTRANWAGHLELSADPSRERLLAGFDGATFRLPDVDWVTLNAVLLGLEDTADLRPQREVLHAIRELPLESLRRQIWHEICSSEMPRARISNANGPMPMELAARIVSQLIAVETLRIIAGQVPLISSIAKYVGFSDMLAELRSSAAGKSPHLKQIGAEKTARQSHRN